MSIEYDITVDKLAEDRWSVQVRSLDAPSEPPVPAVPWDRDISGELARNEGPWPKPDGSPSALDLDGGWWKRTLDQIDKLTFHHTLSNSPHATARHYVSKSGADAVGRPTIPYSIWVTETGEVLLCVPLEEGLWHDHTGHRNTHLCVGMAGSLHLHRPSDVQLDAAARVAAWAILSEMLPGITVIGDITGHQDWISTQCPGWDTRRGNEPSGNWKPDLYRCIQALIARG